ncbi:MAG: serine protease, partial [Rhodospirillales bacterium]|nr:serine protease [Rhodospirillales bacterium]
ILNIPKGWQLIASAVLGDGVLGSEADRLHLNRELMVYLPGGEVGKNWTQAILVEKLRKVMSLAPGVLYGQPLSKAKTSCATGVGTKPGAYRQWGHLTLTGFFACPRSRAGNFGGLIMVKVIEGRKSFYRVRRIWRGRPFTAEGIPSTVALFEDWRPWAGRVGARGRLAADKLEKAGWGTGFVIGPANQVLTNLHVVDRCLEIRVAGLGLLRRVAVDKRIELALLKGPGGDIRRAISFSRRPGVSLGESVMTAGFPRKNLKRHPDTPKLNLASGNVRSLTGAHRDKNTLQVASRQRSGNGGGPLMDGWGNVVGVMVPKLQNLSGGRSVDLVVKGNVAKRFLKRNGVKYRTASAREKIDVAEIAERARKSTLLLECWQ